MTVHGSHTVVSHELREQRLKQCKGSLCVRRNGQLPKARSFTVLTGLGPDHNLGVYINSVDTVERAMTERSFLCKEGDIFRPPLPTGPSSFRTPEFSEFQRLVSGKMPRLPIMSCQQVVDTYVGYKKRIYAQAMCSLDVEPLTVKDSHLRAFVKFEKQDVGKAPRVINPRSARYNLRLGKYLKHAEHKFYSSINKAFGARTPATVIKGFNADRSADILFAKWNVFAEPVAVGLDASKFDMHVGKHALQYEHSFYKALFPESGELRQLLQWQLVNRGVAVALDGTVKFELHGTRCSGDLNTSLGNCILMCAMIWSWARERGVDIELANNGDDCVAIMEKAQLQAFTQGLSTWFRSRGFAMVVEPPVDEFEQIEFCQTRPVQLQSGWRMVRKLEACLLKDPMCLLVVPNDKVYRKWLGAIGTCGEALASGVPVLSRFYDIFKREGVECGEAMLREVYRNRSQLQLARGVDRCEVDARARVSFYYAFGLLPDEQLALEQYFDLYQLDLALSSPVPRDMVVLNPGYNIASQSN